MLANFTWIALGTNKVNNNNVWRNQCINAFCECTNQTNIPTWIALGPNKMNNNIVWRNQCMNAYCECTNQTNIPVAFC